MQDKVLESADFPWLTLSARFADASAEPVELAVSITLRGATQEFLVPAELSVSDESLSVDGRFVVSHQDFGLTPISAAGGLLLVAEELEIEFSIMASR